MRGRRLFLMSFLLALHTTEGGWGDWTAWSQCSVKCAGVGLSTRTRECDSEPCEGPSKEYKKCNRQNVKCDWEDGLTCPTVINEVRDNSFVIKSTVAIATIPNGNSANALCFGVVVERKRVIFPAQCIPDDIDQARNVRVTRLDDIENWTNIYAIINMGTATLVVLTESLFGDILIPAGWEMDYDWYLARHWERHSVLPRLSYMRPSYLGRFCSFTFIPRNRQISIERAVELEYLGRYQIGQTTRCGSYVMRPGHICARATRYTINRPYMRGAPVYIGIGGRIFAVGIINIVSGSSPSFVLITSFYHIHDTIGCSEMYFGFTTPMRDISNPTNSDPDTCDCENWWDDPKACGFEPPLCMPTKQRSSTVNQMAESVNNCPAEDIAIFSSTSGYRCQHKYQGTNPQGKKCYCHNYEVNYKCPYVHI